MACSAQHAKRTRDDLIAAAARLVAERGPEALEMVQVARLARTEVDIAKSFFGSPAQLVEAIYADGFVALDRREAAVGTTEDPVSDLVALCFAYREHALADPFRYRVMFERLGGFKAGESDPAVRRCVERLRRVMGRCVASGVFPERDIERMILQWWALSHGLASLELQGRLGSPAKAEQSWREALLAAVVGLARAPQEDAPC